PRETVDRARKKVASEGWGARLLERQAKNGIWAGGLYSPKWKSTTYTMLALRDLGLASRNRQARKACALLLDQGMCVDGGIDYGARNQSETCITGMVLSILSYFQYDDERLHTVASHLLKQQMPDGGWNCRRPRGATHSSMHTTISVLEGLRMYEMTRSLRARAARSAQLRGREFLLQHRLFRSHRTGKVIKEHFVRMSYPPRWHYDFLRALDYFQEVRAVRDERLRDAISLLEQKRLPDGRWSLEHRYRGKVFFEMESIGKPSRWNTLRALRVLRWWEGR
ncbi:MAG TPA: hypothetical protein VIG29_14090, partial [Vicinamibacteria bacterium]